MKVKQGCFRLCRFFALLLLTLLVREGEGHAVLNEQFSARVTLALCPQFGAGGVSIDIGYRVGESGAVYSAPIISQDIDLSQNRAALTFVLPSTYGTRPLHIMAYCRNSSGLSAPSNIVALSNCNVLATLDTDRDGIPNDVEDSNCDNSFSPGDSSNPDNVDTDGDGARDLVELTYGTNPTNPGSSPRPMIFSGGAFDPDGDGDSNPVAWRGSNGFWYIRDFATAGNHLAFQWGLPGDTPIVYDPRGKTSDVGVVRNYNNFLYWYLRGAGFNRTNGRWENAIPFGLFGDNILPGPWEEPGTTNPAVARLYAGHWYFYIYKRNGTVKTVSWGGDGDVPKVADYDGDGVFDVAVFRPRTQELFILKSSNGKVNDYKFGSGTADFTVRGDFTGDGVHEISFWEPLTGMFSSMTSDNGFNDAGAAKESPRYFEALQLGLYFVHVPLSFNHHGGQDLYTVVDHATGLRYSRARNNPLSTPAALQWGTPGDSLD